jgi:hypothetical protein
LARDAAKLIRDTEGDFLFQHSTRVYCWAALAGKRKGLGFDPELLYVAAMFHDFGLTAGYGESHSRFEVDGANAAREFLRNHGVSEADSQRIWLAIALHTTNGSLSRHSSPKVPTWTLWAPAMTISPPPSGTPLRPLIRIRHNSRKIFSKPFTTASSIVPRRLKAPAWPM